MIINDMKLWYTEDNEEKKDDDLKEEKKKSLKICAKFI